jgi:hypothetical protein
MEIETVDITSLDERQLAALEMLMAKAFADEPTDLLHVEIQRASDPPARTWGSSPRKTARWSARFCLANLEHDQYSSSTWRSTLRCAAGV